MSRCHCSARHPVRGRDRVGDRGVRDADVDVRRARRSVAGRDVEAAGRSPASRSSGHDLEAVGRAGASAIAAPMPRAAPVTSAVAPRPHSAVSCSPARPGVGLVVEALQQRHRLLRVGAGVGVPGLDAQLVVERLADHVEDRLLGRAHRALGVAQDLLRRPSRPRPSARRAGRPCVTRFHASAAGRRSARR